MLDLILFIIVSLVAGLAGGMLIARALSQKVFKKQEQEAREKAQLIIKEAELQGENVKKDKLLDAKDKFMKMKAEFEEEVNKKKNLIIQNESKLKQKEQSLNKLQEQNHRKEAELESMKENLTAQLEITNKKKEEVEKMRLSQV